MANASTPCPNVHPSPPHLGALCSSSLPATVANTPRGVKFYFNFQMDSSHVYSLYGSNRPGEVRYADSFWCGFDPPPPSMSGSEPCEMPLQASPLQFDLAPKTSLSTKVPKQNLKLQFNAFVAFSSPSPITKCEVAKSS